MLLSESSGSTSKFSRVKICVVVVVRYGSNERDGEKRERFWNGMWIEQVMYGLDIG